MTEPTTAPVDEALQQLARRRRDRWIVVAVLVVAIVVAVALALAGEGGQLTPWALTALGVVTIGYGISIFDQERREQRAVRALIAERARTTALDERIASLEHVHAAIRDLSAAAELTDVFDRLLAGALAVTGGTLGAVLLRVGDRMTVAATLGTDRVVRATSMPLDDGPIGTALRQGEPVRTTAPPWDGTDESATIAAPLRLPDRVVGALVVARTTAEGFTAADEAAAALFAEHAALAVRTATRLDELAQTVRLLEEAGEARAQDLAGLVHDLRSPLASISGFVDLLVDRTDAFDAARRDAVLLDVQREVGRLRDLVDGVMHLAVAEAGAIHLDAIVDLTAVAHDAAATGRGLALEQGSERDFRLTAPLVAPVSGNLLALRRVVANLLDNAVAYSPAGTPIEIAVTPGAQVTRLTVRDHGTGIDPAVRDALFEPYVRGARGRTGLGLFVARTLVEACGGHIRLAPADGGGSLAEVVLPTAPDGPATGDAPR